MTGEETKHWKFHHLGVIVHDMEKTVEYYQSLGIVDFVDIMDALPAPSEIVASHPYDPNEPFYKELTSYGETVLKDDKSLVPVEPGAKEFAVRFCKVGTIMLELIQAAGTYPEVNHDFLKNNGEGISHIGYTIDAKYYDQEVEKLKAKGLTVLQSGKQSNGGGFTYFDTRKVGGLMIELYCS